MALGVLQGNFPSTVVPWGPGHPQRKTNEVYLNLLNAIISEQIGPIRVAEPVLANLLTVDGTLYGDSKIVHEQDIGTSYPWGGDIEAPKLLKVNRNDSVKSQVWTIDQFVQCNITLDIYLSKRAWGSQNLFGEFNAQLSASLDQIEAVFKNGYVNTFLGTEKSFGTADTPDGITEILIDMDEVIKTLAPLTTIDYMAYNNLRRAAVAEAIDLVKMNIADNSRDFNDVGFLRAFPRDTLTVLYNEKVKIHLERFGSPDAGLSNALPEGHKMHPRYFGEPVAEATVGVGVMTTATHRSKSERWYFTSLAATPTMYGGSAILAADQTIEEYAASLNASVAGSAKFIRSADLVGAGFWARSLEVYVSQLEDTTLYTHACSLFVPRAIPFMGAFKVRTRFDNARALNFNEYVTFGFNTLQRSQFLPFVVIKIKETTIPASTS